MKNLNEKTEPAERQPGRPNNENRKLTLYEPLRDVNSPSQIFFDFFSCFCELDPEARRRINDPVYEMLGKIPLQSCDKGEMVRALAETILEAQKLAFNAGCEFILKDFKRKLK